MSFSYSYNPKVAMPWLSNDIPQMRSNALQAPFYFGGSQIPSQHIPPECRRHILGGSIYPSELPCATHRHRIKYPHR